MPLLTTLHDLQLTHPLVAIVAFHVVLLVSRAPLLAAVVPVAFYWGREMRDAERALKLAPVDGWQAFWPGSWPLPSQVDFWPVVIVCGVLLAVWSFVLRRASEAAVADDQPAVGKSAPAEPDSIGRTSSKLASRSPSGS